MVRPINCAKLSAGLWLSCSAPLRQPYKVHETGLKRELTLNCLIWRYMLSKDWGERRKDQPPVITFFGSLSLPCLACSLKRRRASEKKNQYKRGSLIAGEKEKNERKIVPNKMVSFLRRPPEEKKNKTRRRGIKCNEKEETAASACL